MSSLACAVGMTALATVTVAAAGGTAAAPGVVTASGTARMPVVAEHKYRMLARVRPLLFWISRDDVGGARISWRGDGDGGYGLDVLIGSDPQRAPRGVNRWGYIAEQVRGGEARVIGVMKQSNEQSMAEAEKQIGREAGRGGFVYRAIQGTAVDQSARAEVTTVHVERDLTFRDIDPLLELVSAATPGSADAQSRSVTLPPGTRPGFLAALHDLMEQSTAADRRQPGQFRPSRALIPYVYYGVFYDLSMKSADFRKAATIDGHAYSDVIRGDFEIRNRSNGEITRFQLTYGTTGELAGIPIHIVYQARWWFEVQLFLDDRTAF